MNFQFQYKEFAGLFPAIPFFILLFIFTLMWKKKVIKRIGDEKLVKALISNYSLKLFTSKFILLSLAFGLGVLAVMNPRKPGSSEGISRNGIDVVITLDVSKSMLATDLPPSRLENAKQMISKLIDKMPDNRIGLVLFAGKAYLQVPMTVDQGSLKMFVDAAEPDAVPQQGTVISDALMMSAKAFNDTERRFKAVVLISDGEDHDPDAIKTADKLAQQGIMINTVGVGTTEGSTIIDPVTGENKKDAEGNTVISKLNEEELKQIAEETHGTYIHLKNNDDAVNTLISQLSQIAKKPLTNSALLDYKTFYMWLVAAMFILLLIENYIPERKRIRS